MRTGDQRVTVGVGALLSGNGGGDDMGGKRMTRIRRGSPARAAAGGRARRAMALSVAAAAAMAVVFGGARSGLAANGTWNPTGFSGANGGGTWGTSTNWTGGI